MSQTKVQLIKDAATSEDSIVHDGDTNTKIRFPAADTISAETAGSERVRVDSSGNVGIGTTNPAGESINGSQNLVIMDTTSDGGMNIKTGTSGNAQIHFSDTAGNGQGRLIYAHANDSMQIYTAGSERMRIDSSGRVGIGTNNPEYNFNVVSSGVDTCRFQQTTNNDATSYSLMFMKHAAATSGSNGVDITFQNSGGTTVGMIDHGQSTTQYRTSSDYRLKENATAISDGITRLKTLQPYRFNWISEKGTPKVDGFFAHEVTPAVPEAISGTKDEVDSDNKPVYQGIDHSKLVPLLTAALQEAVVKIEVLETKVAALEAA